MADIDSLFYFFVLRYNTRNGITIAFTVCGDIIRLEQALVMLKSAVLFSQAKLEVHIFADSHLQPEFRNKVSRTKLYINRCISSDRPLAFNVVIITIVRIYT